MRQQRSTLRAGALLAASALALHELRYLIGYGDASGRAAADQGHSYLPAAGALVALLLALAGAQLARSLVAAMRGAGEERGPTPFWIAWPLASIALLGVYCGQELTEGFLTSGHPGGLAALAGHGGAVVVPLSIAFGFVVALALRGARAAIAAVASRRPGALPHPRRGLALARPAAAPLVAPASVIARNLAGRAPPAAS